MLRRSLPFVLALALLAPAAAQRLPQLEGRPLWHAPLRDAPAEVRQAIAQHRDTRAARLRPPGRDMGAWSRGVMQPWLLSTRSAIQEIERTLGAGNAPPSWRLVGAILVADLYEHFALSLLDVPPPRELASDPEMVDAFTRTMRGTVDPILERAMEAFAACESLASTAPAPLDVWATRCRERATTLRARVGNPPPAAPPAVRLRGAETLPSVCSPTARTFRDEGPAPDLSAPLQIVVTPVSSRWSTREAERVAQEVERTLARRGMDVVPSADARRARALVAQRRWQRGGPVCEVAPPLAVLLADRHPNLVYAVASDACTVSGCTLKVDFQRPVRAGPTQTDVALPRTLFGSVARDEPRLPDWIAAARRLEPAAQVLSLLSGAVGLLDADIFVPRFHVAMPDADPVFAPSARFYARERALRECFRASGIVAFRFEAEVDAQGAVSAANVELVEGTLTGSDRAVANVRSCFERVVRETTFGCPPGGPTHLEGHVCVEPPPDSGGLMGVRRAP